MHLTPAGAPYNVEVLAMDKAAEFFTKISMTGAALPVSTMYVTIRKPGQQKNE